ncbi:MAG: hypothetical protein ABDH28_01335 [Brevinematia bacterium]
MEKTKVMLNSVLHERTKIDRTTLIRYYVNEYKSSNPIFLFQFFKLVFRYIYENTDLEMLDLLVDNFYDEVCIYGHFATNEFNKLLANLISLNKVSEVIKISPFIQELGNKKTLKLAKKFLYSLEKAKYIDSREVFAVKKSVYYLDNKLKLGKKKAKVEILDQGIFVKWKKFECLR